MATKIKVHSNAEPAAPEAVMWVPDEHLHTARALHLASGYDVDILPADGDEPTEFFVDHLVAHAAYLKTLGVDPESIEEYADALKAQRSAR